LKAISGARTELVAPQFGAFGVSEKS